MNGARGSLGDVRPNVTEIESADTQGPSYGNPGICSVHGAL